MRRFQRICLDAVERIGDPYASTLNIIAYVERRRWMFSRMPVYAELAKLQQLGYIEGLTAADGRVVYKRTKKIDIGEVLLASGTR